MVNLSLIKYQHISCKNNLFLSLSYFDNIYIRNIPSGNDILKTLKTWVHRFNIDFKPIYEHCALVVMHIWLKILNIYNETYFRIYIHNKLKLWEKTFLIINTYLIGLIQIQKMIIISIVVRKRMRICEKLPNVEN